MIVNAAIQEDVDAIGLSILSGAHMTLFKAVIDELAARDASDIVVFGGGIVPEEDLQPLADMGWRRCSLPVRRPRTSCRGSGRTSVALRSSDPVIRSVVPTQ